ncbi:hypothetical protein Nepgr_010802 [Nepenthes gracilis]|uniref:Uncharacterized protein n=1 Tax=Nepenthes gracilis TaxID=150966 RepID=A0AAD3SDA6_NEPGR|nr:hypothetical protein Nepgr_010802 [Nepenthes gracilis]
MASQTRSIIQDQSLNVQENGFGIGGKKPIAYSQKKGTLEEKNGKLKTRKPLQVLNRNNSENVGSIGADTGTSKAKSAAYKIEHRCKAQEIKEKILARKPLGQVSNACRDTTNSTKQPRTKGTQLKNVSDDLLAWNTADMPSSSAVEEKCLHDHQECVKEQRQTMSFDYFLETVGLRKDYHATVVTPHRPVVSTSNLGAHMNCQEVDEIAMAEAGSGSPPLSPLLSPAMISSPKWWKMDHKYLEFSALKLKETPVIQKPTASP